jgi:hypothetical protein
VVVAAVAPALRVAPAATAKAAWLVVLVRRPLVVREAPEPTTPAQVAAAAVAAAAMAAW